MYFTEERWDGENLNPGTRLPPSRRWRFAYSQEITAQAACALMTAGGAAWRPWTYVQIHPDDTDGTVSARDAILSVPITGISNLLAILSSIGEPCRALSLDNYSLADRIVQADRALPGTIHRYLSGTGLFRNPPTAPPRYFWTWLSPSRGSDLPTTRRALLIA